LPNRLAPFLLLVALAPLHAQVNAPQQASTDPVIKAGKEAIAAQHFVEAKRIFTGYQAAHPNSIEAEMGIADSELGLHNYEAAELDYRQVVAQKPQMWIAHKNLVIVEAALHRWDEFDRERALLRDARARNEPGITARESDVIDSFDVHNQHWIVREYDQPVGRSLTRYNFERFSAEGRVEEFISLESADAAKAALQQGDVLQASEQASSSAIKDFALDWYNGQAHGTLARYTGGEPSYERVRNDVMRWLRAQAVRPSAK
jgi:tetratricopeptide (TPR) repeat protein